MLRAFDDFFESVTGYKPYKWQLKLCEILMKNWKNDRWCNLLRVPTGYGKTSILLIWYYVLYWQLKNKHTQTMPRRLHYVINRRQIVDDIFHEANKLAEKVKQLIDNTDYHLQVIRIRGGLGHRELMNTESPARPAIYVSTLDGFGCRLLFRGYGMSPSMRSFHAALSYYDSLIILDESHLVEPLYNLVKQIDEVQVDKKFPVPHPRVIKMSATDTDKSKFPIDDKKDFSDIDPSLKKRKIIHLHHKVENIPRKAEELVKAALESGKMCIAVLFNTVTQARQVHKLVERIAINPRRVHLLTGQNRPFELESDEFKNLRWFLGRGSRGKRKYPRIVVATQTIENGVNYDFDYMISELASIQSLIQRAGRLNRFGFMTDLPQFHVLSDGIDDPVYGEDAKKCLEDLQAKKRGGKLYFPFEENK